MIRRNHKKIIILIIIILFIFSCKNKYKIEENNLIENKIEQTEFFISLPENYNVTVINRFIQFSCYISTNKFDAGGYTVGEISLESEVSPIADSDEYMFIENKINKINKIFNVEREWKIYAIHDYFIAEVIIEYKTKWGEYIHFYVNVSKKEEIYKIINLFSTLRT